MRGKRIEFDSSIDWMKRITGLSTTYFAFCSLINKRGFERKRLTQVCNWTNCRESLAGYIKDGMTGGMEVYNKRYRFINRNGMRLLTLHSQKGNKMETLIEGCAERGVKIINFFEEKAGWPSSKLFRAQSKDIPLNCYVHILFGPKYWMKSPHMISLYTFLLRIGKFKCFDNFKTYKQFITICNGLEDRVKKFLDTGLTTPEFHSYPNSGTEDITHLHHVANKIMIILKNQDKLFGERSCKDIYLGSDFYDGITKLCTAKIEDREIKQNFIELCESVDLNYEK